MQIFNKKNTGILLITAALLVVFISMAWIRDVLDQTEAGDETESEIAEGATYQYHLAAISWKHRYVKHLSERGGV